MNEFVFDKDGKPIFDFEGLYQAEECPWGQDGEDDRLAIYYELSRDKLSAALNKLDGNVFDIGCGLGYSTNHIRMHTRKDVIGVDISQTAINRARDKFFNLEFQCADITKTKLKGDIVVLNECLWYIMHKMDAVLANLSCKYVVVNQGFLENQKYGRDIMDGFQGLVRYLANRPGTIIYADYDFEDDPLKNGLVILLNKGYE